MAQNHAVLPATSTRFYTTKSLFDWNSMLSNIRRSVRRLEVRIPTNRRRGQAFRCHSPWNCGASSAARISFTRYSSFMGPRRPHFAWGERVIPIWAWKIVLGLSAVFSIVVTQTQIQRVQMEIFFCVESKQEKPRI